MYTEKFLSRSVEGKLFCKQHKLKLFEVHTFLFTFILYMVKESIWRIF